MVPRTYELADRFTAEHGTVFLSGLQALARIPVEQLRVDRRAGLRTAAFVSGYPGSPLGGFDTTMRAAARLVPDLPIVCRPALNEEYAATAVMGSQLASTFADRRYDGVLGIWYGKAPGVDRAADALRHAVYAGTARAGGAVAFVGDDPVAKSSTIPSSSAGILSDLHMPLLYPADPAEVLDLGRHAVALSRASGLWSALKIVADVADGTASVELDLDRVQPVIPEHDVVPRAPDGWLLTPHTLDLERDVFEVRSVIATQYAAANRLNTVTTRSPHAWIGIVASGITYREVREAFRRLGLPDEDAIGALGIRLLKMQMPIPFDPASMREFARGLDEVFVIEEKQPNLELLVKDALYPLADRPLVVGKHDEHGRSLVPGFGGLDADAIVPALRARLGPRVGHRLAPEDPVPRPPIPVTSVARTPFYCSGCPHNRSTVAPPGTAVGAGIGCHTMVMLMDHERVGDITSITCMGNEGTQWIGIADFVERDHFVQNLGDGTYFHSGQLAITAAIAAGVDITYKLLYNGAIAMTGGQAPEGRRSVASVAATLLEQGVSEVLITTDDPRAYRRVKLPKGARVWHRDRLPEAQAHLARVPGVTVLIHDQACAAELRRARKRGLVPTPTSRVVINHRVCEGCGDCADVSGCLSLQPFDTPFGRKTRVDQTTCNLDFSCLVGDCPSFMTVDTKHRARRRRRARGHDHRGPHRDALDELLRTEPPRPTPVVDPDDVAVRMVGIGGTGVVTVAQVIGTAAMLDGFHVRGLDQTGLSQKAGPVVSDLHLTRAHDSESSRLGAGQADLLLVLDVLGAASEKGLVPADPERTAVVGSTSLVPTGEMALHPDLRPPSLAQLLDAVAARTRADAQVWADAVELTTRAFGDAVTANMLVAGMAVQAGALPVDPTCLETAIRLNGTAVEANLAAFRLGRHVVLDAAAVAEALETHEHRPDPPLPDVLAQRVRALGLDDEAARLHTRLVADLVAYQDAALAAEFLDTIEEVAHRERAVLPGSVALTTAVARGLHKLMAAKDEYEVARLLLDAEGRHEAERLAADGGRIRYHLHPPVLRAVGLSRKIALGPWFEPVLRLLVRARRVRGSLLDPFRWTKVRRVERRLPGEYREAIREVLALLDRDRLPAAVAVAELPEIVRGYEDLKLARVAEFRARLTEGLTSLRARGGARPPSEALDRG